MTTCCITPSATFAGMKVVMCLFSLWILLLTGLPCPDAECHAQSDHTTSTSTSHSADDDEHKAPCSPFCHCTTCLGFFTPRPLSYTLPALLNALAPTSQLFIYQSPNQSDVAMSIWQPPKL
ncbi:hypothetical protein GO755_12255 [Spirosoma sp. HMF4905]|uniref:Uncharacterized protein n=1 Tax=Spirosoma arboris TaxID=2682092 RepID=A0A7K1SAM7_9BACT|nr:DUF6660 family protein [Spirosoma arboris]MVM30805.1 hypothetical protein [Spirosoma arboris]